MNRIWGVKIAVTRYKYSRKRAKHDKPLFIGKLERLLFFTECKLFFSCLLSASKRVARLRDHLNLNSPLSPSHHHQTSLYHLFHHFNSFFVCWYHCLLVSLSAGITVCCCHTAMFRNWKTTSPPSLGRLVRATRRAQLMDAIFPIQRGILFRTDLEHNLDSS